MAVTTTHHMTANDAPGLGPKKTVIVMVIVVGCIAFLWPKVFYPMMFGGGGGANIQQKPLIKDHQRTGCCDVVLDQEEKYGNVSQISGDRTFRKRLNLLTDDISIPIRQERPSHLRPESMHPAMRERGRNIPPSHAVPIVERTHVPPVQPRVVEGRPGPIPGMRPPMGAGSVHQPTPKSNTMGFLMPLYTVVIVSFFIYTIMKLVFRKPTNNLPYGEQVATDPNFRKQVFEQEPTHFKRPDDGSTKLVVTAIQGLIDAADEQMKRRENAAKENLSKETKESPSHQNGIQSSPTSISNGHANKIIDSKDVKHQSANLIDSEKGITSIETGAADKGTVKVLGMEMTASVEGGHKWSQPLAPSVASSSAAAPVQQKKYILPNSYMQRPKELDEEITKPQSIYLEGALPHESQILVAESEVTTENAESDVDGDDDEPAVVLSSKMTLSLISLDPVGNDETKVVEAKVEGVTKEISPEKEHQVGGDDDSWEEEEVVDKIVIEEAYVDDDEEYEEEYIEEEIEVIGNDDSTKKTD